MKEITKEVILAIEEILDDLGISVKKRGFNYWIFAVIIKLKYPNFTLEQICSTIAAKYSSKMKAVQNCMWKSLVTADNEEIQRYFRINYKVTPSVFLECVTKKVKRQIRAERR